jgi:hypothetical protein
MAVAPNLLGYGDTPEFGNDIVPWATKAWHFLFYVEPATAQAPWAFAMVASGLGCISAVLLRARTRPTGVLGDAPLAAAVLGFGFAAALGGYLWLARLGWDHAVIGIATTFPFLPLVIATARPDSDSDAGSGGALVETALIPWIRDTALLFVALVVLIWPVDGGLQWGARYLLPAYPLLFLAAAHGFESHRNTSEATLRRVLVWGSAALLAVALLLQGVGVHRRFAASEELEVTRQALLEMNVQLVATDRYFFPSLLASMGPDIVFLDVVGDDEIRALIPKVAAVGMDRIAVVSRPGRKIALPPVIEGVRIVVTPEGDGRTLIELK